jgi:Domain of unknown function (DUF4032)
MTVELLARTGHPDFLDLPWEHPLEQWESERLVNVSRGISRHVVRFVQYGDTLYALKELPRRLAEREYGLLRALENRSIAVVKAVGLLVRRPDRASPVRAGRADDLPAVLITRHLEFSLPYRMLFRGFGVRDVRTGLLDALVQLLVRLHLAGFWWGDCSLSNTLFRRDAGALAAYLVDAETGELHPQLTDGQRMVDLEIAETNIAGELLDLQAAGELPDDVDPMETAGEIARRYGALWTELTREEAFGPEERYRIDQRLQRLNELGFDVAEVELVATPHGHSLRLPARVVEPGHHRRRLFELTGLWAQENQARRLLNDLAGYRCMLEFESGRSVPEAVAAHRWLLEVFEPTIQAIPSDFWGKLDAAEMYHQILEHRWFLSEAAGNDVGMNEAVRSYVDTVLRFVPAQREVLDPVREEAPERQSGPELAAGP